MHIKNLTLKNFRNYADENFTFTDGLNVLYGRNAQGKTNCAEAVFYLCTGVSPRARRDRQLIRQGQTRAEISAVACGRYGDVNISAAIFENGREIRVNGNKITKNADLLGNIFSVFFSPSELRLIQDGPDERRRFLNISISQLSRPYYTALLRYNKILEQRNNLLKDRDTGLIYDTLPVWDEQLAKYAAIVVRHRTDFVTRLAPIAKEEHLRLTDGAEELEQGRETLREQEAIRRQIDHVRTRLEERSAELEDLMEHISGGMHQCGVDGGLTLLSASPSFLNLCGYSREELHTRFQDRLIDLICPQDRPQVLQQLRSALAAGESVELEYRLQRGDGQTVWLLSRGTVHIGADGRESIYNVVLDVTRRKHMEEDLRLSLERHRIIMEQSTDVIFEWDLAADKLFFSSNWKKKFGYTPASDHLSQHLASSTRIHPDDRDAFMIVVSTLTSGTPYAELELRLQGRGDRYFWYRIRATVQNDTSGNPVKVVGIIADIDADKRHQQQQQHGCCIQSVIVFHGQAPTFPPGGQILKLPEESAGSSGCAWSVDRYNSTRLPARAL